jgi:DNA-binding Lrp family transcriptional regulator
MSKTILADVEGWTPVIDTIVEGLDLLSSVVFGRVWRYCQMEDGVCRATVDRIADGCGLSRKTVERRIEILCEKGYIKDLTPNLKNRPHTYMDTGKAALRVTVSATSESRSTTSESRTGYVRESHEETYKETKEESNILSADADPDMPLPEKPEPGYKPGPDKPVSCEDPDTGETVGEPNWRFPQAQRQHQAFNVTGRRRFQSRAEHRKMLRIEQMLEHGELPEEWWKNRVWCAEQHRWSFPNLLKYTLDEDKLREWEARQ